MSTSSLPPQVRARVAALRATRGLTAAATAGWPDRAVGFHADDGEFMVLCDRGA